MLGTSTRLSPIWYDDAGHFIVVRHFVETGTLAYPLNSQTLQSDPDSPFITMGPAVNYPAKIWMQLFGTKMIAARWLIVLFTLAFLVVFWAMSKSLLGEKKAFWALLLVGGNIQLLTYGAEFLGELPMLLWLFLGLWGLVKVIEAEQPRWGLLVSVPMALLLSIGSKEYILATVGLGLVAGWVQLLLQKKKVQAWSFFGIGLAVLLGYVGSHLARAGSFAGMLNYFSDRASYGSEFFALDFKESLRFVLFKPLILLGAIALGIRIRLRKEPADLFLGLFWAGQWILFLVSAGYDRFGFQLLFIPAIYLAEFMAAGWERIRGMEWRWLWGSLFVLVFLAIFTQNTFPVFIGRALHPEKINTHEKCVVQWLQANGQDQIFTFDQQLVPFLPPEIDFRLSELVPSQVDLESTLQMRYERRPGEVFVEGEYGRTEYKGLIVLDDLLLYNRDTCGVGEKRYTLYWQEQVEPLRMR